MSFVYSVMGSAAMFTSFKISYDMYKISCEIYMRKQRKETCKQLAGHWFVIGLLGIVNVACGYVSYKCLTYV